MIFSTSSSRLPDLQMEVDSVEPEPGSPLEKTLTAMRERGVKLIYGNWLIEGAPRVILFDTGSMYHRSVIAQFSADAATWSLRMPSSCLS